MRQQDCEQVKVIEFDGSEKRLQFRVWVGVMVDVAAGFGYEELAAFGGVQ